MSYDTGQRSGALEYIETPSSDQFGSQIVETSAGCLFFSDKSGLDARRQFFVYCPIGAGKEPQVAGLPGTDKERLNWFDMNQMTTYLRDQPRQVAFL